MKTKHQQQLHMTSIQVSDLDYREQKKDERFITSPSSSLGSSFFALPSHIVIPAHFSDKSGAEESPPGAFSFFLFQRLIILEYHLLLLVEDVCGSSGAAAARPASCFKEDTLREH